MFYGAISELAMYKGLYKGLDVVIDLFHSDGPDLLKKLALGKTEILGDKVFVNTMEPTTRPYEGSHYEWHHHYMDLQIDIEGSELIKVAAEPLKEYAPYDAADDFGLKDASDATDELDVILNPKRFVLFLAHEAHMPTLSLPKTGPTPIKKVCFKLLSDEFWSD